MCNDLLMLCVWIKGRLFFRPCGLYSGSWALFESSGWSSSSIWCFSWCWGKINCWIFFVCLCALCHGKGENFSNSLSLINLSVPWERWDPCAQFSLSVSHYGDLSLNSPVDQCGSTACAGSLTKRNKPFWGLLVHQARFRDTCQQHKRDPVPPHHSVLHAASTC